MNHQYPEWEVSVQEVKALLDRQAPIVLLDVRQPEEHTFCRIHSARLTPLSELAQRLEEIQSWSEGRAVIAYCHHGGRSLKAASLLRHAGIEGVKSMAGGIEAWSVQIDPTVPRY